MTEWYVTFGCQYPREPHPFFPDAHKDGHVVIVAQTEERAREIAIRHLGTKWSFIYSAATWDPEWFPRGELARWSS